MSVTQFDSFVQAVVVRSPYGFDMTHHYHQKFSGIVRYSFAPFMLLGVNGLGTWVIATGGTEVTVLPVILVAVVASFAVERLIPFNSDWNRADGDLPRDLAHAVVNEGANLATIALLPTVAGVFAVTEWPHDWPFWAQVVAAILVLDGGITLAHYLSHRSRLLWRIHAVHHSVTRMYGFNGLMKHPLHQSIEMLFGATPLIAMGLPHSVGLALVVCTAVQLLLQHSNADYRLGPLRSLLALNEVHRLHHLRYAGEGDVNFGLFTTFWDRVLGTYHWDVRRRIASGDLGLQDRSSYPVAYLEQLREPFRRMPDLDSVSQPSTT